MAKPGLTGGRYPYQHPLMPASQRGRHEVHSCAHHFPLAGSGLLLGKVWGFSISLLMPSAWSCGFGLQKHGHCSAAALLGMAFTRIGYCPILDITSDPCTIFLTLPLSYPLSSSNNQNANDHGRNVFKSDRT